MKATDKLIFCLTSAPNEIGWDPSVACGELEWEGWRELHIRSRRGTCASGRYRGGNNYWGPVCCLRSSSTETERVRMVMGAARVCHASCALNFRNNWPPLYLSDWRSRMSFRPLSTSSSNFKMTFFGLPPLVPPQSPFAPLPSSPLQHFLRPLVLPSRLFWSAA